MYDLICSGCLEVIGATSEEVKEGTQILCIDCRPEVEEEEVPEEIPEEVPEG